MQDVSYHKYTFQNNCNPEFRKWFLLQDKVNLHELSFAPLHVENCCTLCMHRVETGDQLPAASKVLTIRTKRDVYITETIKRNNWTVRQLEEQIYSSFETSLLSNDKEKCFMSKTKKQYVCMKSLKIMCFGVLGLKASYYRKVWKVSLSRTTWSSYLELGKWIFLCGQEQKRIHIGGDWFFVDLVFYNRILQCLCHYWKSKPLTNTSGYWTVTNVCNYYDHVWEPPKIQPFKNFALLTKWCKW